MNKIGERLKALRIEKNLTQTALGEILNITQDSISLWEKGKRIPDAEYLIMLSKYFGCSVGYLLGVEDDFGNMPISSETDNEMVVNGLDEKRILKTYRALTARDKELFMRFLSTLNLSQDGKK